MAVENAGAVLQAVPLESYRRKRMTKVQAIIEKFNIFSVLPFDAV